MSEQPSAGRTAEQPSDLSLGRYCLEYDPQELLDATRHRAAAGQLGSGAYGDVFRGELRGGTDVAVKFLSAEAGSGFEEEVRVLSKFRHPNLVTLMGFARSGQQRMLVYEYLGGGDLYSRMAVATSPGGEGRPFPWRERVSAARDAACGLAHLHGGHPRVFHRDIKSPNILLDQNGTAKMADFGLACLSFEPAHAVKEKAGTVGYACPLYSRTGVVTEASEVFSFGMVLLELLTGSPAAWSISPPAPDAEQAYDFLLLHINGDPRVAVRLADAGARWPQATAFALAELGLRCVGPDAEARPEFLEVLRGLRGLLSGAPEEQAQAEAAAGQAAIPSGSCAALEVAPAGPPALPSAPPPLPLPPAALVSLPGAPSAVAAPASAPAAAPDAAASAGAAAAPGGVPAPPPSPAPAALLGTSLAGDVAPAFLLRASGCGVRSAATGAGRVVVHGPPLEAARRASKVPARSFPALVLGRGSASGFWQSLLVDTTFAALSREHMVIEACSPGRAGEPAGVCVKNLSAMHPIRVSKSAEGAALDAAEPLGVDERRRLRHGDFILVVECKGTGRKMLLLQFEDLRRAAGPSKERQECVRAPARAGGA